MPAADIPYSQTLARISARQATVGVIGLGYVGLPVARAFVSAGFRVIGFDIDPAKVERLNRGESYIGHIPAATIQAMRAQRFEATTQFERLSEPDAIIICV